MNKFLKLSFLTLLVGCWLLFNYQCRKPVAVKQIDDSTFSEYISGYTSGIISKTASIKVRVTSQVAEKIKQDKPIKDLFNLSPEIKGQTTWLDDYTVEFKPDENFKPGQVYEAKFNLNKLANTSGKLKTFDFNFQTIKQSLELDIERIEASNNKNLKLQKLVGHIKTADYEELDKVKAVLAVIQDGKNINASWRSNLDGTIHTFIVDSIKRKDDTYDLQVTWNGNAIGVEKDGIETVQIPALGNFVLVNHRVIQQPEQYVELQFSDPLNHNQNLTGLIKLQGAYSGSAIIDNNIIKFYPSSRLKGEKQLTIYGGIKNVAGYKLKKEKTVSVRFEELKPAVRLACKGTIMPTGDQGIVFPFEAVNLKAVDVTIIKIYENQIQQFLQVNDYSGGYELRRVAKPILIKSVDLTKSEVTDFGKWNRFTIDLNKFIKTDPGAFYRIGISFKKSYSLYNCGEATTTEDELTSVDESYELEDEEETSGWDGIEDNYYYYDSDYWDNRDNPCHEAYYRRRKAVYQNIFASDIGLIAKKGNNNSMFVFATNMLTTNPLQNATIKLYSYQNQVIETQTTSSNGIVKFEKAKDAYFVVAEHNNQKAYIKIKNGNSLSLSHFDVSGVSVRKGLKGFIYGERGVWRPGDSIYVTFVLQEDAEPLPENHPIVFELKNPQYQVVKKEVLRKNNSGFYSFHYKTDDEAPTGNWGLNVKIGGVNFNKSLKIETVKPNRLKIKMDFPDEYLVKNKETEAVMNVKWLHGAVGKDLKVNVTAVLNQVPTRFNKYNDYTFDDPTKKFYPEYLTIHEGKTDAEGNTIVSFGFDPGKSAPGKLHASFITKVFEKSGDFSVDQFSKPFFPYESYLGLKVPKGDKRRRMLLTDTSHVIEMVIVDPKGDLVEEGEHIIEMEFYKLGWRWWWENSGSLSNYAYNSYNRKIAKEKIKSKDGKAKWKLRVDYPEWGRYLVRAHNLTTGHSTAKIVYIDWPGYAGRQRKDFAGGASVLTFETDKEKYSIGEQIKLNIPSTANGHALISVESGTKVLETRWVETQENETEVLLEATSQMTPNVYINVSLLQPHAQTANDLPIRMYGIKPVLIENPETHLKPLIDMPDELESEKEVTITVKEEKNRPMTYTLAIVDEGLLDLTRFKTPDPWNSFYAREALGVRTWDMYDDVIGAFSGQLEAALAIGGDGAVDGDKGKKAQRFKPMVKFLGPFFLEDGKHVHKVKMPRYIGSVRTMVIAGHDKAYGNAEKTTPVKKPLMILGTLPRVLSPTEKVKLPVTIFAMDDKIRKVKLEIKSNDLFIFPEGNKKTIEFDAQGEQMIDFDIDVASKIGIGKIEIHAKSGNFKAQYDIELDVRNPNPRVTDVYTAVLEKSENWKQEFIPPGIEGTNNAVIEVSSIPPLNLEKRIKYLTKYPHGCIEQTTSKAFPQLYLSELVELDQERKNKIEANIKHAITRISTFQIYNGGFGYWPNSSDVTEWGTNYAGHFLLEARKKGYAVSESVIQNWIKYQTKKAKNWTDDGTHSQFTQAYRLYTLALADKPNKGAMNHLKEKSKLTEQTQWRLAAAYAKAGKKGIAEKMVKKLKMEVPEYTDMFYTYGSGVRDEAMILETLSLLGNKKDAFVIMERLAKNLASTRWYSTQTTAYSLIAIAGFVTDGASSSEINFSFSVNGSNKANANTKKRVFIKPIEIDEKQNTVVVENKSDGMLYVRVITDGIPTIGQTADESNDLQMEVVFKKMDGSILSPDKIPQGTDFMAEVSLKNPGIKGHYDQMALSHIFPAGWEILNPRMLNYGKIAKADNPTYQDYRDDRVYTYFGLRKGKKKTFRILLNAAYAGKYYMPDLYAEAMYDATINARKKGMWVEVVKSE